MKKLPRFEGHTHFMPRFGGWFLDALDMKITLQLHAGPDVPDPTRRAILQAIADCVNAANAKEGEDE